MFKGMQGENIFEQAEAEEFTNALAEFGHSHIKDDNDFDGWIEELNKPQYNRVFSEDPRLNAQVVGGMAKLAVENDIGMNNDVKGLRDFVAKERGWTKGQANAWVRKKLAKRGDE